MRPGTRVCPASQDPAHPLATGKIRHSYPDGSRVCVSWDLGQDEDWVDASEVRKTTNQESA